MDGSLIKIRIHKFFFHCEPTPTLRVEQQPFVSSINCDNLAHLWEERLRNTKYRLNSRSFIFGTFLGFLAVLVLVWEKVECAMHSMARAILKKSTSQHLLPQHQSTCLRGPESVSIEIPPFRPNLLSKSTSKCERCEVRFT